MRKGKGKGKGKDYYEIYIKEFGINDGLDFSGIKHIRASFT